MKSTGRAIVEPKGCYLEGVQRVQLNLPGELHMTLVRWLDRLMHTGFKVGAGGGGGRGEACLSGYIHMYNTYYYAYKKSRGKLRLGGISPFTPPPPPYETLGYKLMYMRESRV